MPGNWVWNFWAPRYDRLWVQRWALGKTRALVRERLAEVGQDARTLLDAGCGTGQLLEEIAGDRPDLALFGFDPAPQMIEQAVKQHRPGEIRYQVGRLCEERDGPFDIISMCNAFPYVGDHDRAARRLFELIRPGGRCWIVQGNTENLYDVVALRVVKMTTSRATYHSTRDLAAIFAAAGFEQGVTRMIPKPLWVPSVQLIEFVRPEAP